VGRKSRAEYAGDELTQDTRKLQWVTEAHQEVVVSIPDVIFLEEGKFNEKSLTRAEGFVEESASNLRVGDIVQFPRFGFCRLDSPGSFILAGR
jgi:glutamyl-tRNA synthetase